jgi:hypothetical protein
LTKTQPIDESTEAHGDEVVEVRMRRFGPGCYALDLDIGRLGECTRLRDMPDYTQRCNYYNPGIVIAISSV